MLLVGVGQQLEEAYDDVDILGREGVEQLADLVVVMSMGRIEQIGKPQDIRARPASAFVRDFVSRVWSRVTLKAARAGRSRPSSRPR